MSQSRARWIETFFQQLDEDRLLRWLLLAALIGLGAGLRFFRLGEWSFWGDEFITVERALGLFLPEGDRPSLSLALTKLALTSIGVSEWSARLVPALGGILTIPVLYYLSRRLFDVGTAFVAGLLLAVSPWHLYWSQNARFYSFMLLFFTAALVLFYLGIEEDRPLFVVLALCFFGLAILERLISLLFLPVVGLYVLLLLTGAFGRPKGLNLRNLLIFTLPGLVPGIYLILTFPAIQDPSLWSKVFSWVNNNPLWIFSGVAYYLGVATICAAAVAMLYLISDRNRAGLLLTLGAVIPLAITAALSLFQYAANRYVFVSLTSWLLLAAVAARGLIRELTPGKPQLLGLGMLFVLMFSSLSEDALYYLYQHGNRDNWREAYQYISEQRLPDDLVVSANPALGHYYLDGEVLGMANLDIDSLDNRKERIWVVEDMTVADRWPSVKGWLSRRGEYVREFDVRVRARNFEMNIYLIDNLSNEGN